MNEYDVIFEQNNLNSVPGVRINYHEFNYLPQREVNINKLARRDMSIITSAEYSQKSITVSIQACGGVKREDTEEIITQLKQLTQTVNGELKVLQSGLAVKYTATMNEFNIRWEATTAFIEIVFIASNPLGQTVEQLTFADFTHNTPQSSATGVFEGSGTIEPVINISITSITGSGVINILNARTNQGITIDEPLSAGDILTVDSLQKRVTLNNGLIDFGSIFPVWASGTQQILVTDTYASRDMNVDVTYNGSFS